jgi:hypothetical protein
MPTGYTSYIKDGKITSGKEFLKLCTRAFGIAVDLKDESLDVPTPNHFEPDPYYEKAYKDSLVSRERAYSMTFEEVKEDIISKYNDNKGRAAKILEEYKDEDKKYLKVREEVEKWIPPTPEHENLKKFCLEQIDMSLNTGLYEWCEKDINKELDTSDDTIKKYINILRDNADEKLKRTYKKYQAELKRVEEKNLWMKQFLDSLENTKW